MDSTGLIVDGPEGVELQTGVWSGPIGVTTGSLAQRPAVTDMSWEDIAEFSVIAEEGPLVLCGALERPAANRPRLDGFGPGPYRIRVHARGRDDAYDTAVSEATEEYLFVSWPEIASPAVLIALASRAGRSWIISVKERPPQTLIGGMHASTMPAAPAPADVEDPQPDPDETAGR
ncbi:hypothetical protein [Microterricola viridarii]|uniref:hypothetical protein n=1 Tax=Microterricola viridarii TaxID=412690 RepID=UPI0012E9AFE8|nr:hypothetical protein [Microterricola viridarii]